MVIQVYVKRLEELKGVGDQVVRREAEFRERPQAFDELARTIVRYEKIVSIYKDKVNRGCVCVCVFV